MFLVIQLQTNHNCAATWKLTTYCCIASTPTVTACCQPCILTLFARISKPLWLNIRSTGAEVAGGQFHASWAMKTESSMVASLKTKTETETRGFQDQDQDQDSEVPRPRRPRPRLVKRVSRRLETKTQVSRTPSLMNSSHKWARLFSQIGLNRTFLKQSIILWGCPTKVGDIAKLGTLFFSDFLMGVRGAVYHPWNVSNTAGL